ncbi:flippase [Methanolobus sp. WCC5]|uniref:flippase n=1 Tax=Methanolobus sp. WCC5 TaxID=3125785 RepID=UPI00324FF2BE
MKDVQWAFIGLATASLSHLLLRIVLGRELGPSGLGIYTLVYTIYLLGMQFSAFGVGAALTKYVAEFSDDLIKAKEYISSGLLISLIIGSLMGIFLFMLSEIISINIFNIPEMYEPLKITAIAFPFIAIYKTTVGVLNGFRNMKAFALLNISINVLMLVTSIVLVLYLNMNIAGAVFGFVLPTIAVGLLSVLFIKSHFRYPTWSFFKTDILRDVLRFGFYVVLGNSIGYIYIHIDSLMIGYYLNETELGFYTVALVFVQGITLISSSIQSVTNPIIAKNYAKKEYESILKLLKSVPPKTLLISFIITLLLILFGKTLIVIIFEVVFLPAYSPLIILLVGYTIYSAFNSIGTFYSSIGYVQLSYKVALISAAINIMLNILFIPKYGIVGAALASSTSLILLTVMHFILIGYFVKRVWALKI